MIDRSYLNWRVEKKFSFKYLISSLVFIVCMALTSAVVLSSCHELRPSLNSVKFRQMLKTGHGQFTVAEMKMMGIV